MANIYARLGAGDRALECLEILTRSCTACNLLTYHNDWRKQGLTLHWGETFPPFQMDANFGLTAAVIEMLLFSKPGLSGTDSSQQTGTTLTHGLIKLLPALPTKWPTGQINGLLARGGVSVDIQWDMNAGTLQAGTSRTGTLQASLTSHAAQMVTVKFPFTPSKIECHGGEITPSDLGDNYRQLDLPAGQAVVANMQK